VARVGVSDLAIAYDKCVLPTTLRTPSAGGEDEASLVG
jgi:hypothetical protein